MSASKSAIVQATDKKVRTAVTGTGKNKSEAENDTVRTSRQINTSYTAVNKKTSGADKNYVLAIVIKYNRKYVICLSGVNFFAISIMKYCFN